jgi:hypothetical protein
MTDSKWEKADALIRQSKNPISVASGEENLTPLAPIQEQIESIRAQKLGLMGDFKKNKITREAALRNLKAMHDAQTEASQHALRQAVSVDKQRVNLIADKYLFQLNEEYLRDMRDLGLKNFESRNETLLKLNESAARLLERALAQDVPAAFKESTVKKINEQYEEFLSRLMEELKRLAQNQ